MGISWGAFAFLPVFIIGGRAAFSMVIPLAIAIVTPIVAVALWGLVAHAILVLTGPKAHGLRRTYHALGYSSGVNVVSAIPCVGVYVAPLAWIWWIIAATVMTREAQRVSALRAFFAVAAIPAVLATAIVAWFVVAIVPTMQTAMATARTAAAQAAASIHHMHAQDINQNLVLRAGADGRWPAHVAELVGRDRVSPASFLTDGSAIAPGLAVAGIPLETLSTQSGSTLESSLSTIAAAVPPDVVAYRVGDYILTYPGLPLPSGAPDFWTFIAEVRAPYPGVPQNTSPAPAPNWLVGLSDGTVREIADADFAAALAAQNELRAAAGLQPLPAPADVQGWVRAPAANPGAPAAPTANPP
jgi:hypothetical protein